MYERDRFLPVDERFLLSCLQDKVHKHVLRLLSLNSLSTILLIFLVTTQILVCVEYLLAVETHLRYFDLQIYNIAHKLI